MYRMNKFSVGFATVGGTMVSILPSLVLGDIYKTIVLAAVGALVSFLVSLVLGALFKRKK